MWLQWVRCSNYFADDKLTLLYKFDQPSCWLLPYVQKFGLSGDQVTENTNGCSIWNTISPPFGWLYISDWVWKNNNGGVAAITQAWSRRVWWVKCWSFIVGVLKVTKRLEIDISVVTYFWFWFNRHALLNLFNYLYCMYHPQFITIKLCCFYEMYNPAPRKFRSSSASIMREMYLHLKCCGDSAWLVWNTVILTSRGREISSCGQLVCSYFEQ